MSNFENNINPEDILTQKENLTYKKKENTFDLKNYLQAKLSGDETSKTLTIRLLPFTPEGGTPFHKVWMHMVKVNKEISASGWKTFPCPTHNKLGDRCPFCEVSDGTKDKIKTINDEPLKKKLSEVEFMNRAKEYWVVRCIERGHEEDGVKFWLFPHSKKNDGVYNKIINKFQTRYEAAKNAGKYNNIFDLNTGRDIIVVLSKTSDGKTSTDIDIADDASPLSDNYELGVSWVNDTKKWNDVFTVKNTDYMSVVATGGVPVFSKEKNKYVNKYDQEEEVVKTEQKASIAEPIDDTTLFTTIPTETVTKTSYANTMTTEDDLPF